MTVMLSTSLSMPVTLEAADIEPINRLPVVAQCCVGHVNTESVSAVLDTCNIEPVSAVLDTST